MAASICLNPKKLTCNTCEHYKFDPERDRMACFCKPVDGFVQYSSRGNAGTCKKKL